MAFYECKVGGSGGGIPPQLQTDMNTVFNKKFGTTGQSYPSTDWADNVNIMGLLPEKTVSGAVASFADGADDVPLKTATFNIDPTLDGVSAVNVVQQGANLADFQDGKGISTSGIIIDHEGRVATVDPIIIKEGVTYYAKANDNSVRFIVALYNDDTLVSRTANIYQNTALSLSGGNKFYICAYGDSNITVASSHPMVVIDNSISTYESYSATTRTISLGQTVYGGSVTVDEDGECDLDNTHNRVDMGSLSWSKRANGVFRAVLSDGLVINTQNIEDILCEGFTVKGSGYSDKWENEDKVIWHGMGSVCYLYATDSSQASADDFTTSVSGVYVTYPLATPTTSTLTPITPITSALGVNNIWCDTGDVESLTYRAQAVIPVNVTIGVNKPTNSTSIAFSIVDASQTLYSETITCDVYGAFTEKTINFTSQGRPVSMKIKGVRSQSADIPFFFIECDGWSITFTANGSNSSYECNKTVNAIL